MKKSKITCIKHEAIDRKAWDKCIYSTPNGRIYGLSWYLDVVSPGWDALIDGDYNTVMPLPWKKKYLVKYLVQPYFTQQLGIFGSNAASEVCTGKFLESIPGHFIYMHLKLNSQNTLPQPIMKKAREHDNFLLDLSGTYGRIRDSFSTNHHRNLKKASKQGLHVDGIKVEEYIDFKSRHSAVPMLPDMIKKLRGLLTANKREKLLLPGVFDRDGTMLAAAVFFEFKATLLYLNGASSKEGKNKRAMFYLMDHVIRENAGKLQVLDFEGSDIPAVARFFAGFGASPSQYCSLKTILGYPFR